MPFPGSSPTAGPDQDIEAQEQEAASFVQAILFLTIRDIAPFPASILAVSTEAILIHVSAQDVVGGYLSAAELVDVGMEMCFVVGPDAPAFDATWYRLTIENKQIAAVYAPAYLIVGPGVEAGAGPSLTQGTYNRWVRTQTQPHVVRRLSPLTVEGPNP